MAIGHVLTGRPVPVAVQWVLALLLFGGAVAGATLRLRSWRRIARAVAVLALCGTIAAWVLAAVQPGAAPYTVRIVSPPQNAVVTSPVTVTICGFYADGIRFP